MTSQNGRRMQKIRIFSQVLFLLFYFFLLIHTGAALAKGFSAAPLFFFLDPLIPMSLALTFQKISALFLLCLVPVILTLFLGRFFCGWICPFGTLHQFFTWLFRRKKRTEKKVELPLKQFRWKYIILLILLVSSLFGVQFTGWLDPFSLFTRSSAVLILPGGQFFLQQSLQAGADDQHFPGRIIRPIYRFSRRNILPNTPRTFEYSLTIGVIFLFLVALNAYRRRFFCNTLCPLGALYGFLSRYSILNLKIAENCRKCNACAAHCTYYGGPYSDYLKSECLLCFNCVADCPVSAVELSLDWPEKTRRPAVSLERRRVLASLGSGLALAVMPGIAASRKYRFHSFVRPPGSIKESEFLEKCIRCGECIQACPNNALHPAHGQAGLEGLWTPILVPANGFCDFECNRCTQVCPTGAIEKLALEKKKEFKIGTAVIDRSRCYTYADGYNCAVCEEHCPVPEKAIKFRTVEVWTFRGKLRRVKQIYVDPRLCIGCGTCEHVCPRTDKPAIVVGAEEEQREGNY